MIKKFSIIFTALFLSVVLFELFLRYSPFSYGVSPVVYDKDIGMWHKKNFSSNAISECYNTKYYFDQDGLVKLSYMYDETKQDVLILGDSFTEAIMVQNKNIIHNALWKEYKGSYNFLNYGLSGTAPTQQFVILEKRAKLNNVNTVLQIINIDSDIYDVDPNNFKTFTRPKVAMEFVSLEDFSIINPRVKGLKDNVMDIVGNYQLYIPLKKVVYIIKDMFGELNPNKKKEQDKDDVVEKIDLYNNWLQIEGAIYQTKKFLDKKNINYKILINSEKIENIAKLSRILNKYSIPFLDLNHVAKKYEIVLPHFSCDKHWNDTAHQNIAKIVYKTNFLENKESKTK